MSLEDFINELPFQGRTPEAKLAEELDTLPNNVLLELVGLEAPQPKVAMGGMIAKSSRHMGRACDSDFLEEFEESPLYGQAVSLAEQELEMEKRHLQARMSRRLNNDNWEQESNERDMFDIQKSQLTLELHKARAGEAAAAPMGPEAGMAPEGEVPAEAAPEATTPAEAPAAPADAEGGIPAEAPPEAVASKMAGLRGHLKIAEKGDAKRLGGAVAGAVAGGVGGTALGHRVGRRVGGPLGGLVGSSVGSGVGTLGGMYAGEAGVNHLLKRKTEKQKSASFSDAKQEKEGGDPAKLSALSPQVRQGLRRVGAGALGGGALGAATGAALSKEDRLKGALIGGVSGAGVGALAGSGYHNKRTSLNYARMGEMNLGGDLVTKPGPFEAGQNRAISKMVAAGSLGGAGVGAAATNRLAKGSKDKKKEAEVFSSAKVAFRLPSAIQTENAGRHGLEAIRKGMRNRKTPTISIASVRRAAKGRAKPISIDSIRQAIGK